MLVDLKSTGWNPFPNPIRSIDFHSVCLVVATISQSTFILLSHVLPHVVSQGFLHIGFGDGNVIGTRAVAI